MSENIKKGRPIGSKNKPKVQPIKGGVNVLKFEKQVEGSAITKKSGMGYRYWGQSNDYPTLLLNLYNNSTTHRAAINFGVQSIVGNGVDIDAMGIDGTQVIPNYQQTWDELIKSVALDYMLFGSYALELIQNKDRKTYSIWHIPLDKVRWSDYDEDGQITSYWICNDWTQPSLNPPFEIDAFDMRDDFKMEYGKPYLYVYRPYNPSQDYYTTPIYQAGIKAIQSECEYINFDLKTTVNSFCPSGMLVLNQTETDEERDQIIRNVTSMFQGTNNASSLMITFRNNVEEQNPTFVPFQTNNGNVNLFDSSNQRTINRILSAHMIPNAALIGLPDIGNSGFSSEADKLEVSYRLYNKLTGNSNRMAIIKTLNWVLKMNGVDVEIIMRPLTFVDDNNETTNTQSNNNDTSSVDESSVKDTNVEEKVV